MVVIDTFVLQDQEQLTLQKHLRLHKNTKLIYRFSSRDVFMLEDNNNIQLR